MDGDGGVAWELTCEQVENSVLVVHIAGELDMLTAPRLEGYVREQLAGRDTRHVVLDLAQVAFLGSSGLAALLALVDDNLGVQLHLVGVRGNRAVERPIDLMGLNRMFDIHDSLDTLRHRLRTETYPS